ncbi:hypothetical protein PTE30175_00870 [Pandoraea terrae]|uniref:RapA2 cadherin-like domain-containing protein n=1 Tax=Pandoraea terrae TaxID=1537710 RepID=A0A5E4SQH6_9BURK|nr:Ig-like domain-containing protein [Pandoraea terrae]VVD77153.1 hypothetical protein PTE30175_00870 [Pandoraea terrae]
MRPIQFKATLCGLAKAGIAASMLVLATGAAFAQTVSLTAKSANAALPDGQLVPMWGYSCGAAASATCTALNPSAAALGNWSPVVITVAPGPLTISLTNNLPAGVPTSMVIVGQVGGGLGAAPSRAANPVHATQAATWPIAGNSNGATFTPPTQLPAGRVQSFGTEVATNGTTTLSWTSLKPGTYLIESGTHPSIQGPMGLYGVLVVTTAPTTTNPAGTAYTGVTYNADVPLLLSEIDAVQNAAVAKAVATVGFKETANVVLRDTVSAVTVNSAGTGYHVGDAVAFSGGVAAGDASVAAAATVASVDANGGITSINVTSGGSGYSSVPGATVTRSSGTGTNAVVTAVLVLGGDMCTGGAGACYPPAVNYDPRYYLINGVAFDRTNLVKSQFSAAAPAATGQVLLRFVNAGLRMHVPTVVGAQTGTPPVSGFSLIAEDGNLLPGIRKVQSEVFLAAGKTYDVMMNAPATGAPALPVFDRQLSLSTDNQRDGGMQAYISVNNGALPTTAAGLTAVANNDTYNLVPGNPLIVSDPAKGVIANDIGVYGVTLVQTPGSGPSAGTVSLNPDGTFTYVPNPGTTTDTFTYYANGNPAIHATVTLQPCTVISGCMSANPPTITNQSYTSTVASRMVLSPPGLLASANDPSGLKLTAALVGNATGGTVTVNPDGSFAASPTAAPAAGGTATVSFQYKAVNSQNTAAVNAQNTSSQMATATVTFVGGSGLNVVVKDAPTGLPINDYRWIIEEDRTFQIDPACQVNQTSTATRPAGCPPLPVPSVGTNFHTSYMPVVASGCWGTFACEAGQTVFDPASNSHLPAVCDIGNGKCRTDAAQQTPVNPGQVVLDPTKRYYLSILPGDAGNPFASGAGAPVTMNGTTRPFSIATDCGTYAVGAAKWLPGTGTCGHGLGGAPLAAGQKSVNVVLQQTPLPTATVSVYVFEDDSPLNGEVDVHGGVENFGDSREPGLGGFEIKMWDDYGSTGDATGQMSYDMFNMPLSNALQSKIDPATGLYACPISVKKDGLVGMIPTCPKYESDGKTLSPLVGQAVITNLMPGRYGIIATPAADRIGRGEEWLQTNTLDGQKAHDSFIRVGGPTYFQEFGPAGFHVAIGFANPKIINDRRTNAAKTGLCDVAGAACGNSITGRVTNLHYSRPPNENLYGSGSRDSLAFTQCYVSAGDPDGDDIAFTKCNQDGTFTLSNLPDGTIRVTVFDQWNDQIVDGLAKAVAVSGGQTVNLGDLPVLQWHTNLYTRTFIDLHGDGVSHPDDPGLALVPTNIRFRDGSYSNFNNTDLNGYAPFNEVFPLFNWYVVDPDPTRFKNTGTHVVYDAGGPTDGTGLPGAGTSTIAKFFANTVESSTAQLPAALRVPGAVYCGNADCTGYSIKNGPGSSAASPSTGRIDPPWVTSMGWQGFSGQNQFIEFGKTPFVAGENGGIRGEVAYASTRAFDDPTLTVHAKWLPNVPNVTVNLYQEGTAADGTTSLKLVDTTKTTSWDDWAQGFRSDGMPNMNCPGQENGTKDPFFFTLAGSKQWLNPNTAMPNNSQFKCYDGMHAFNQVQPAPFDGSYQFPSVTGRDPNTGKPTATNCKICTANPSKDGTVVLPAGKYVVEVIVPPGYELMKEEDKNILIGDNFIAPVTQQFGALTNIFIIPDQAAVNASQNPNNAQNPTTDLGSSPRREGDTGSVEQFWPCVGTLRIVPDYLSLFPGALEVAPFAGASRHLCDRKEVLLNDQMSVQTKFYIFSSTHVAAHFTGFMLDDFSAEFDPFSPQFGEKFAVPNVPVSLKDFTGNEMSRVYSDQWGIFNGLTYSTWEVNPPNPTGYAPNMMIACMNDPDKPDPANPGKTIRDPLYNPAYSQFCYEIPFMPGLTQYMDTPVVPVQAFASGYNPPDCAYPDATPAVSTVLGDLIPKNTKIAASGNGNGPWVSQPGHVLTINALGDQTVPNNAYSGPAATTPPFNQKFITRHYGFGTTKGTVTVNGFPATVNGWSDTQIQIQVPAIPPAGFPVPPGTKASSCPIQQRNTGFGVGPAYCGELVITAANGKKSVDAVTVTIGGKTPIYISGENAANNAIQSVIDDTTNVTPGDMIVVGPGTYNEMLLMWRPLRLQGVGAPSVIVNANTHPSGKLDPWRREVNCLFGIALDGAPITGTHPYDPANLNSCKLGSSMEGKVDAIPFEPVFGWDSNANGNLAELLIEPSLMGAYEGAGITVLGKGVTADPVCVANGTCPPLTNSSTDCNNNPSNFLCNPSRIDAMSFSNSSQGGGGIFVHGYNHNIEIANNRVFANAGTLTGGITIGQVEVPDGIIGGADGNTQQPFNFNMNVNVHNNAVTSNASYGDEINSSTPASAGGVTFCSGADNYHFNYNWVCGNMSSGDGGGMAHFGFSYNGDISHNWVLFNQSNNPTLPTYGGGIIAQGVPPDATFCENALADTDCAPELSDGIGPNLTIDSNLIIGNTAESGKGGGLRLQAVNGTDVQRYPTTPAAWYQVKVVNNIIANNVAGWAGGGVSLQDAVAVNFINNTVVSNDSTASAGVLFNTAAASQANVPPPTTCVTTGSETVCTPIPTPTPNTSYPLPAGLETAPHTALFSAVFPTTGVTCPTGGPSCAKYSNPVLTNNIFWQNRSFSIQVGGQGAGIQQNIVTLQPALPSQTSTGSCPSGANYWDIGVYNDKGPRDHSSGLTLNPTFSILTDTTGYAGTNKGTAPGVISQYCNGARVPPENGGLGYAVPPGIADAVLPNPMFALQPSAVPDEGNNWINMSYGPLSLVNASIASGSPGYNAMLGNYSITSSSAAYNVGTGAGAPPVDIFGTQRPQPRFGGSGIDIGAVEVPGLLSGGAGPLLASLTGGPVGTTTSGGPALAPSTQPFGTVTRGTTGPVHLFTLTNSGSTTVSGIGNPTTTPTGSGFVIVPQQTNCGSVNPVNTANSRVTSLAPGASCVIAVQFNPPATAGAGSTQNGTLNITDSPGTQTSSLQGTAQ